MSFIIEKIKMTEKGYLMIANFKKEPFRCFINFDEINYEIPLTETDLIKWTNKIEHIGISRRITSIVVINIFSKIFREIKNESIRRSKVTK